MNSIIRLFYPIGLLWFKIFSMDQNKFKRYFINVNNKIVLSKIKDKKVYGDKILVLLPHCLQNSDCNFRITGNKIDNCKNCGKCIISEIKKIKDEYLLNIEIATGGYAARNKIKELKPSLIFAVACENDLASGIFDISKIPVIGLLNSLPNGPCKETTINIDKFKEIIKSIKQ